MLLSDFALSKRLEGAEGHACLQFAKARRKLFPECDSEWMEYAGAQVVFDGVGSPVTQTFGLGIFEPLTDASLDRIEQFFFDRGSPAFHEVSPLAGVPAMSMLCAHGYKPIEISSVLYRLVEKPDASVLPVRLAAPAEMHVWADVSARGWTHEHPELTAVMRQFGAIAAARDQSPCFLAELDGKPAAAGALSIHNGVALFTGAATIPEMRRRGLQSALLQERMRYASDHGCDLAMMVAEAGSESQRNAERKGFRIAYTRTKWGRFPTGPSDQTEKS